MNARDPDDRALYNAANERDSEEAAIREAALQARYDNDLRELIAMPSQAFLRVLAGLMEGMAQAEPFDCSNPYLLSEMVGRYNSGLALRLAVERMSPGAIERGREAAEKPPSTLGVKAAIQKARREAGPESE